MKHWKSCECRKCERGRTEKLRAENERLRESLEMATSWLEAAAMGCDQGGSQYGDAAKRAREALNGARDDE